jgi:GNAT superfamily N-acetyltransferase
MIEYRTTLNGVTESHLRGFFAGWAKAPTPATHLRMLRESDHIVLAFDTDSQRVVGFITAITDRVLTAYIPHVEVLPDYQDRGIGSELTRRMLDQLKKLYAVDLLCDPSLQRFYGKFKMQPVSGMMLRRYEFQRGAPAEAAIAAAEKKEAPKPSWIQRVFNRLFGRS